MSGPSLFGTPRRWRRGATLTLVFSTMLAGGAAVGSLAETGASVVGPSVLAAILLGAGIAFSVRFRRRGAQRH